MRYLLIRADVCSVLIPSIYTYHIGNLIMGFLSLTYSLHATGQIKSTRYSIEA
jgi:hypothetical protein